ncbi:MAG: methionine--tRNA ligase subunit beta [Planctomycetes bacterium]|nr:methionine--tRNA ligase subunit beta [Planctomycetota bacterium]
MTIKTDAEGGRATLTAVINAVKILTIYLKAVLPVYAGKIETFLNVESLGFEDVETVLENHKINKFVRLVERVEKEKVGAMTDESKEDAPQQQAEPTVTLDEPLEPECTIEDVMKVDLRVAKVVLAEPVEGANKLLHLELDIGGIRKNVFAGISKAYKPEDLIGKHVICVANLKPRKMKFGVSEGMILAAGPGGKDIFVLGVDDGATPGQRVH